MKLLTELLSLQAPSGRTLSLSIVSPDGYVFTYRSIGSTHRFARNSCTFLSATSCHVSPYDIIILIIFAFLNSTEQALWIKLIPFIQLPGGKKVKGSAVYGNTGVLPFRNKSCIAGVPAEIIFNIILLQCIFASNNDRFDDPQISDT